MIQKIFSFYGIDFRQWKTLTRLSFQLANRQVPASSFHAQSTRTNNALIFSLIMYFALGLMMLAIVFALPDLFWSSFVIYSYVLLMIGFLMLVEFGSIIVAPDDYNILSYQPVSSRTYFAAKTTFALVYVLLYTAVLGLPSSIAYGFKNVDGHTSLAIHCTVALAALIGFFITGIGIALAMIILYTSALRFVRYRRLKNILSYVQAMLSFLIMGSYALLPSYLEKLSARLPAQKPWWIFLLPPSWTSTLISLASGTVTFSTLAAGFLSLAAPVLLIPLAASKISLSYAENLSAALNETEKKEKDKTGDAKKTTWRLKRFEDRAIITLIRAQFKRDMRFRFSILAIIPMTILYGWMGLRGKGAMFNPFHPAWRSLASSSLLYLAIIIFPVSLVEAVSRSESYLASWIFFSTPVDKVRLTLSIKDFLYKFFIVPYIVCLGIMFSFFFDTMLHVVMHTAILLLISRLFLQLFFILRPQLPFSLPQHVGDRVTVLGSLAFFLPLIMLIGLMILIFFVYTNLVYYALSFTLLTSLTLLMDALLNQRVKKKMSRLEFAG